MELKLWCLWFLILSPTGSFSQLKRNRLEDATNIYNKILLPVVVQVSWKIGKVEKDEAFIHHWKQEKTIRLFRKICRVLILTHTAEAHSEPSQTYKMELCAKMINIFRKSFILDLWQGSKYVSVLSLRLCRNSDCPT